MNKYEGVQKLILESNSKNELVSAGAGSGKTTIMIQKIADMLLKEKVDVDSLLVVTFTVLAAQEMKDRLIEKMSEELASNEQDAEYIANLIEKIKTASIDTIDGFSSKTIKKYFYNLEISPNIEIISDSTRDYYLTKAMKKTIDDFSKQTDKINLMIDLFGGKQRNTKPIEESILSTYYNVVNLQDYDSFLTKAYNEYINGVESERVVNDALCARVENLLKKLKGNYSNQTSEVQKKINAYVGELEDINPFLSLKTNLSFLKNVNIENFSRKEVKDSESLIEVNAQIKRFNEFKNKLEEMGIDENFDIKNEKVAEILSIFIDLVQNFIKNYNFLKEKNNLIDFNDLNRLMLKLLDNDEIRLQLQQKYKYIFIDEYQDVNPLQDGLMSKLVGVDTKLFMVGDVKQSIYGFRGASPEWFLEKYNTFKQNQNKGEAFDMNVNFRSSPIILNFINQVFSKLMTKRQADIDYLSDCIIDPKRTDIVDDKVKILLVNEEKEKVSATGVYSVKNSAQAEEVDTTKKEAMLVSNIITQLINTDFYDAKLKKIRKLTYKDIAILSRSEKDSSAQVLIEHLKSQAIPLNLTNKLEVKENECIRLILSILKCVVRTADDVDYLATFMAITDMDIDEFISIRNAEVSLFENLLANEQLSNVKAGFDCLNDIKNKSYTSSNAELIKYILDDKKLRYTILRKPEGQKELNVLEEFVNKLSQTENNLNLAEFIEVVESNVSNGGDFASNDNEDSVTLQTIHKSKGLEYPVVILYNAGKQFQYINEHDGINFNADIGLGMDYFDIANRIKTYSLTKYAIRLKNLEKGYKEELRLLYVALTRAKNKLFITGSYNKKILEEKSVNKTSYLNMILDCFIDNVSGEHNEFEFSTIDFIDNIEVLQSDRQDKYSSVDISDIEFEYSQSNKFKIPFKNTVTGINSQKSEENKFVTKEWITAKSQYNASEDRALIGTHYHKALELLDLTKEYTKNTDFEDVDYNKIRKAHEVLHKLVDGAVSIHKESDFMMYVPYNEIVESDVKDKVLVQGVVDLIIEKENSVDIVDYKFSKLSAKTLKEKYGEQLLLYKKAVESAFNKKVEHMYIYSIDKGELF